MRVVFQPFRDIQHTVSEGEDYVKFENRTEAGQLLSQKLKNYKNKNVIVYALPRGGVVTGVEIAKFLHAPLDLIITRKITYPYNPEYAIAAVSESGKMVGNPSELLTVDEKFLREETEKQRKEAARRRREYAGGQAAISAKGKIAILADDGVATGLSLRAGILEIKSHHPEKIIVAVPVIPFSAAEVLRKEVDDVVALEQPSEDMFLGAVGAYYEDFKQVEDFQVVRILEDYKHFYEKNLRGGEDTNQR